jgi:prepilin-type N-terminal cleavage/methylation domain-containing protein
VNNKGYTLIELIAAVALLAVIMLIAIPGISSLAGRIRQNQRNNVIKKIEIAASNYAFDTKKTEVFVDELVKEGYYTVDKDSDIVIDPVNGESMNCYLVIMEKVSEHYNAKFQDGTKYENNGVCVK